MSTDPPTQPDGPAPPPPPDTPGGASCPPTRRTNAQKRETVLACLNDPVRTQWSNLRIAQMAGCSDKLVAKMRDETGLHSAICLFERGGQEIETATRHVRPKHRAIEEAVKAKGKGGKKPHHLEESVLVRYALKRLASMSAARRASATLEDFQEVLAAIDEVRPWLVNAIENKAPKS